jgi:hypothetical protein
MAQEEKSQKKVRRGGRFGRYAYGYVVNPIRRSIMFGILKIFGILVAAGLAFFLLSGGINQVRTGETLVEYALDIGHNISEFLNSLTDGTSPFKFTDDGVYFKDADVPENGALDGKEDLIDGDDKLGQWKEDWNKDPESSKSDSSESSSGQDEGSNAENGGK